MKLIKLFLIVLLTGFILVGCYSKKTVITESNSEERVKATSDEVISMICDEKYDKVIERMSANMKKQITEDKLKEVWEPMKEKLGEFEQISEVNYIKKGKIITVVEIAKFEGGKAQFTITFNEDMEIEGLYLK